MTQDELNEIKARAEDVTVIIQANILGPWEVKEFVRHAREDIPALLAEVERLQKRLAVATSLLSGMNSAWGPEDDIWDNKGGE